MELQGIGALVAGGASGLGAATARMLTENGARVAIADLDGDKAQALAEELGGVGFEADVTNEDQVAAARNGAGDAGPRARPARGARRPPPRRPLRARGGGGGGGGAGGARRQERAGPAAAL